MAPRTVTATQIALANRPRRCCWSTSTDVVSGLTGDKHLDEGTVEGRRTHLRRLRPSRACSPSTAPPSTARPGRADCRTGRRRLARLGKRVHRTDIGWESRQVGGPWTSPSPATQDQAASGPVGPPTCHSSSRRNGSSAQAAASQAAPSDRPGYPAISKRDMPYRVVAFTEQQVDMAALGFEPDTVGFAGTELIRPADPRSSSPQPPPATQTAPTTSSPPTRSSAPTTATTTTQHHCRRPATGCSSWPTPLRPPPQPAQLTARIDQTGAVSTCRRCLTELRHTQAASFVSPRPAYTQTASRVKRYALASLRRISRSGS